MYIWGRLVQRGHNVHEVGIIGWPIRYPTEDIDLAAVFPVSMNQLGCNV